MIFFVEIFRRFRIIQIWPQVKFFIRIVERFERFRVFLLIKNNEISSQLLEISYVFYGSRFIMSHNLWRKTFFLFGRCYFLSSIFFVLKHFEVNFVFLSFVAFNDRIILKRCLKFVINICNVSVNFLWNSIFDKFYTRMKLH